MGVYKYCARCRRTILDKELEEGLVLRTGEGLICDSCIPKLEPELLAERSPAQEAAELPSRASEPETAPTPASSPEPASDESVPETAPSINANAFAALEEIRRDVQAIYRTLLFSKGSAWNVLGAVAQCFAVGALLVACINWGEGGHDFLLLALLIQMIALTLFVKGK